MESILYHNARTYGHFNIVKHFNIPDDNGTTPFYMSLCKSSTCKAFQIGIMKKFKMVGNATTLLIIDTDWI